MSVLDDPIAENHLGYLDVLPLSALVFNPKDGKIIFANKKLEMTLGYDSKSLKGQQVSCLFQDEKDLTLVLKTVHETGRVNNYLFPGKHLDNSLRWLLLSTESILGNNGSFLIVSTLVDITQQKNEEAILQERERLYQAVFNSSPVMKMSQVNLVTKFIL